MLIKHLFSNFQQGEALSSALRISSFYPTRRLQTFSISSNFSLAISTKSSRNGSSRNGSINYVPVDADCDEGEDAATHREDRYEAAYLAVDVAEGPVAGEHVDEVEGDVQGGHHRVGDGEVDCK